MDPNGPYWERVQHGYARLRYMLLERRADAGYWAGELSTSALSTATAIVALESVRQHGTIIPKSQLADWIEGGLRYLAASQNADGGWGDTSKSVSNISTSLLAHASIYATKSCERFRAVVDQAEAYIEKSGGMQAACARYGKDRTFSAPIMTHTALAGLVPWSQVAALPFEFACLPQEFFRWLRLPVVSYALPALIAVGQAKFHHDPPANPIFRRLRSWARKPSLRRLEAIQPSSGGFLEATPLTSFVVMCLASIGLADHPVTILAVSFLASQVRSDGSWPIDSNLATWLTTLSVNALEDDLPDSSCNEIADWLLTQQHTAVHPYTNAAPGGWAWTDLPGGVPDADDTAGALLALRNICRRSHRGCGILDAVRSGVQWLLKLQNADGGWPTFCRGWGALEFDRSGADLTAHAIRALAAWVDAFGHEERLVISCRKAIARGRQFLDRAQRQDGSWLPLWFGNQYCPDDENPTYGTCRVLGAYRDLGWLSCSAAQMGLAWLIRSRHSAGGWGGGTTNVPCSVEETALAVETLGSLDSGCHTFDDSQRKVRFDGVNWLLNRIDDGTIAEPAPIGFYFAKLWYFDQLYPIIFTVAALRQEMAHCRRHPQSFFEPPSLRPSVSASEKAPAT